jgi:uncharacterized protein (DUF1330 family)
VGAVDPERSQFEAFKSLPRDQPVHMLNLVRVRAIAAYAEDHPNAGKGMTGLDAYRAYGRDSRPVFERVGGRQVWIGSPECVLIGPADEGWDIAFVAEYPTAGAFLEMVTDPVYREAVKHRQAAVEDSRLIRTLPLAAGAGFGESQR